MQRNTIQRRELHSNREDWVVEWLTLPISDQWSRVQITLSRNSAYDCIALHCTEPFIITLPSSQYDLNNVERDVKHQTTIIKTTPTEEASMCPSS